MGISWKMSRLPESLAEELENRKQKENEGIWKPVARDLLKQDPGLKDKLKKKDPEVAEELGLNDEDGLFESENSESFSVFD